ncbi:ESF1 protein, partial [Brachypodius atriceps]|nr:ESF1 protein [Brachypodius atriceps]
MSSQQEILSDGRFSRIARDPRFWEMPEKERKVKIDKRFRAMFHDKKFKLSYTVDKRGRPVNYTSTENLRKFYALSESDSDLSEGDGKEVTVKKKKKKKKAKGEGEADSAKALAGGLPKEESKKTQRGADQTCEAVTKLNDLKKGQKPKSKFSLKEDSEKPAVEVDRSQGNKGLLPKGENKQGGVSGGKSISIQSKEKSSQATTNKRGSADVFCYLLLHRYTFQDFPFFLLRVTCNSNIKMYLMFIFLCSDQSEKCRSQLEEESASEEAESEEESQDGEETGEEEELEDDGETGEDDSDSEDDEEIDSGPDLARGIGNIETSSEDDEDLNELFPKEPEIEHSWRELDKDAPRGDEITSRLAVCNMDWDRLKAKDLLALFNSFTPKGGTVFSVKIYPSEFGKERLKEEEQKGPVELFDLPENTTEDDGIYREKLREYQFKRLKYFYAVVECDSPETANKIYEECDGLEFESSCSFIDLRFIPDNVTFDDKPKDAASEVNIAAYKPKYFTSAAMGTSKVDITWDETDHERVTSLSRTFNKEELLDMDFQAYLASSSEEEEEQQQQDGDEANEMEDEKLRKSKKDDEEQIAKYRELLQSIQEKEKKQEEKDIGMEIKWVPGLKESAEEMVKNRLEGKDNLTPWQKYLEKKKEKRILKKKRKAAAEREESEDELPPDVDLNDPYFAEELEKTGVKKKPESVESTSEDEDEVEKQKAEMALLMMDDEDDTRKHFNYKKIVEQHNLSKKKKKLLMKKKELLEDDFQVNVADTRFQAMFTSPLFNLDPSDPNFKKTKAVEKILEEKARRREEKEQDVKEANKGLENNMAKKGEVAKKTIDPALSMLIKSVKNKTEEFQARKKQKFK